MRPPSQMCQWHGVTAEKIIDEELQQRTASSFSQTPESELEKKKQPLIDWLYWHEYCVSSTQNPSHGPGLRSDLQE